MREREGGSELILTLLEGGTYLIFPLVKLILGPPFLIIIAQSLSPKVIETELVFENISTEKMKFFGRKITFSDKE